MMGKIIRLTIGRCDKEYYLKFENDIRYLILEFNRIYNFPEDSIEEVEDFFTADLVFSGSENLGDLVLSNGGRFTKKGFKEVQDCIYGLHQELVDQKPHQIKDEISSRDSNISFCDNVVDKN